ncbi:MAG TPA: tetratricopeptide repeat protein [Solimonas sp.]|nr:tetratricopeptide repeat protein [Solimonas sp.]
MIPLNQKLPRQLPVLLLALVLGACASQHGTHERPGWPYPEPPIIDQGQRQSRPETVPDNSPGVPQPLPPEQGGVAPDSGRRAAPNFPRTAEAISGSAVASLIRQAQAHRAAGQPAQAAASLERALRIEPRNYFVWAALAQTHLDQRNYDQAESVALKSNSLARGNVYVEQENWKTIAAARRALGNAEGAQQAQARVDQIQRMLSGE